MNELKPCGTFAAYVRHRRNGTPICRPCYAAHAAYEREFRARRTRQQQLERDLQKVIHVLACAMGVGRNAT